MKPLTKWLLFFLIGIVIIIGLFIFNQKIAKCQENHEFNTDLKKCFYPAQTVEECKKGDVFDGTNCLYSKKGFINDTILWGILGSFIFILLILLVFSFRGKKSIEGLIGDKPRLSEDLAHNLIELNWAKNFGLYERDSRVQDNAFTWLDGRPNAAENGEWFLNQQAFIKDCENIDGNGLWVFEIPLSKGEDLIKKGGYGREKLLRFEDWKAKQQYRRIAPTRREDIALELLGRYDPDALAKAQIQQLMQPQIKQTFQSEIPEEMPMEQGGMQQENLRLKEQLRRERQRKGYR